MLRPATRILRYSTPRQLLHQGQAQSRRTITTAPLSKQSRSWKSYGARWALAIGGIWYYNTSEVFAESGTYEATSIPQLHTENETLPTIDAVRAARRQRQSSALATPESAQPAESALTDLTLQAANSATISGSSTPTTSHQLASTSIPDAPQQAADGSPEDLEEEAASQGAFNEETGEINWDCPCLGGMAHGPCGPEFREAFSCFVFSKDEPKGVDCIDRFKNMQDCFRAHPDVYGAELGDDGADDEEYQREISGDLPPLSADTDAAPAPYSGSTTVPDQVPDANLTATPSSPVSVGDKVAYTRPIEGRDSEEEREGKNQRAKAAKEQVRRDHGALEAQSESADVMPKAWHDGTVSNTEK